MRFSSENESENSLSLIHAMKVADVTRKHYHGGNGSSGIPPGALQGATGFLIMGAALMPIRRLVLRYASRQSGGKSFANFVDIVISVGHALVSTQTGLVLGSLYGSQIYLDLLRNEPTTSNSPLTDKICDTMWSEILPPNFQIAQYSSSQSLDPRMQTMSALQRAIKSCKRRQTYQQSMIT
jgi:hypothetical protein